MGKLLGGMVEVIVTLEPTRKREPGSGAMMLGSNATKVTLEDEAVRPPVPVARALNTLVPAGRFVRSKLKKESVATVTTPTELVPMKNSTWLIVPLVSVALAS